MKHILALLLLIASSTALTEKLSALDKNTKMGKPTQEELTMTQYDLDPEAKAVVLYRGVEVRYSLAGEKLEVLYTNKVRIKVLKPEGIDEGDISIVYYNPEKSTSNESISGLKASSYNLENGKVVRTKMSEDLKNRERIDSYRSQYKFSIPNVKVGSVIEYEYTRHSDFPTNIDTWYAQRDIPVFHTTYYVSIPNIYIFHTANSGFSLLPSKEEEGIFMLPGGGRIPTNNYTYTGDQLPKLEHDDYVFCVRDYYTKVSHELNFIQDLNAQRRRPYTSTWQNIDSLFMADDDFGKRYKMDNPLREEQAALNIDHSLPVTERVALLRDLLLTHYKWNDSYRIFGESTNKLKKEKTGCAGTLNFALMAMLHDEGIQACPVLLSRRNTGRLPLTHASIDALNGICLQVATSDSTSCYVDASAEDYPVGSLRPMFLVDRARVIPDQWHGYWTDLRSVGTGREVTLINAQLTSEGLLSGKAQIFYEGVDAAITRTTHRLSKDSAELVAKHAQTYELEYDTYQATGTDNRNERMIENITFHKQLDADGERIYVNPFLFVYLKSGFKTEERLLPVEFGHGTSERHSIQLQLPAGYEIEELPKGLSIAMPDNGINCKVTCVKKNGTVTIRINYNRSSLFYSTDQYATLRDFWSKVENTTSQMIVLKKSE